MVLFQTSIDNSGTWFDFLVRCSTKLYFLFHEVSKQINGLKMGHSASETSNELLITYTVFKNLSQIISNRVNFLIRPYGNKILKNYSNFAGR